MRTTKRKTLSKSFSVHIRCESQIENSSGEIDDVSRKNIIAMKEDGVFSTLQNKGKLDAFYINTLK